VFVSSYRRTFVIGRASLGSCNECKKSNSSTNHCDISSFVIFGWKYSEGSTRTVVNILIELILTENAVLMAICSSWDLLCNRPSCKGSNHTSRCKHTSHRMSVPFNSRFDRKELGTKAMYCITLVSRTVRYLMCVPSKILLYRRKHGRRRIDLESGRSSHGQVKHGVKRLLTFLLVTIWEN